ncbi:hypothetical protein [uncultured Sulfitobacter sp.]|uniref:hypothetical protein n=1 Tax=uncultured Sulfitobacter sp. TaxID=191468 RepID=UPI002619FED4|nr:hypothetical protein [uncultured Sulfitobacter sp.]
MRFMIVSCMWLLSVAAPSAAVTPVGQRVYEGEEAAAIRCANMMALTGVTLHRAGMMSRAEKEILLGISFLILDRHVSGNWTEKKRAMEVMRDRRSLDETLEDYQRNAPRCLERFSIN